MRRNSGLLPLINPETIDETNADIVMENMTMLFGMYEEQDNTMMCLAQAMHYGIEAIRELREIKEKAKGDAKA